MPIESAPKDGTDVLLAEISIEAGQVSYGEIDVGAWEMEPMSYEENGKAYWLWMSNYGRVENPTHWMPLPPPPQESGE